MSPKEACKRKVFYDTEFQATVVAARREAEWGKPMKVYPCGRHFHIASARKTDRGKFVSRNYCEACQVPLRPGRWERHKETGYHKSHQYKLDNEKESSI